jgi:hypothetical protein
MAIYGLTITLTEREQHFHLVYHLMITAIAALIIKRDRLSADSSLSLVPSSHG